ncbi:hypothetical protein GCM10028820_17530 [Tessaracoccus terricola]
MKELRSRLAEAFPWWLGGLLGILCVVTGAVLALRPFRSLGVLVVLLAVGLVLLGVSLLAERSGRGMATNLLGLAAILAGVAVLVLPGLTIQLLTLVVAAALVVVGVLRIVGVRRTEPGERLSAVLLGVASVVLGVVALAWPDVTVLVIAAVSGVQLVLFGIAQVASAWRRRSGAPGRAAEPGRDRRRTWRTVGAVAALLASAGLLLLSIRLTGHPQPDDFYAAPADLPAEAGVLLRTEAFATDVPEGAEGWRILYTTTLADGVPAVASAIVVAPDGDGDHPVVAWAHGTTGQATGCAPSLLEHPFEAGAMPDLPGTLAQGWAVVAPDYPGLGTGGSHPYLVGQPTGRSVLDAIRAAQQLEEARLGEQTMVWGHSQGGHAALWTGGLAESYAPELDVRGVVAMAPAANLPQLLADLTTSPIGPVFGAYVIAAWEDVDPSIRMQDYVRPAARIGMEEMAGRCLSDPSVLVSVATSILGRDPVWSGDPSRGPVLALAHQNVPELPVAAPLLIAQGEADTLVRPQAQQEYVAKQCEAGQELEYRTYPGMDHMGLVTGDSQLLADLVEWTEARFAGGDWSPTC